jgi:hypothetical protein
MNPEDNEIRQLRLRVSQLELLVASLVTSAGEEFDEVWRHFFRKFLRRKGRYYRKENYPDLDYLLEHVCRPRSQSRLNKLESRLTENENQNVERKRQLEYLSFAVETRVHEILSQVTSLANEKKELSAETHEWLALQSLGLDSTHARIRRFIPVRVYLSETPGYAIQNVSDAIDSVVRAFGFNISDEFPEVKGSWFKKWFVKTKEVAAQPEVAERLAKIERAIDLKGLGLPQASIDEKQAAAVTKLMKAVESVPNAAIQAGSILLIKINSSNGPIVQVRTLTQRELLHLENNQCLLSSPADLLQKLSALCNNTNRLPSEFQVNNDEGNTTNKSLKRTVRKRPPA